ncbi:hypothetical protein CERSUDRAFT_114165 [Gelatoporia subvermispora B]|uniref:Uncharacterized protein n=1 Tax=Ceriporiopsis subvermispora (strain B) TaxID=914234 RepID=M2QZD1_CERS8|nr:hypothetical protein CERSUDRAFT_114165 [Gelatoporia subvermispora B]
MSNTVAILPNGSEFILKTPYTNAELKGIAILLVVSVLSIFAIIGLLVALALSAWNTRKSAHQNLFIRSRVAAYFISLLLCNLCQGIGSLMNARWYANQAVSYEPFCTAQGALKQVADVGTAYWYTTIAMNAFWILFLRWEVRNYVIYAVLIGGWAAIGVLIMVGPAAVQSYSEGPFYGISGYWCWISNSYEVAHITLDYMFMFSSAVSTFVLYLLIFLNLRGNIWVNGWRVYFRFPRDAERAASRGVDDHAMKVARQMLLFPFTYMIMILPIGVCRFLEWSGHEVPFTATVFSDSVYLTSGIANVFLFAITRRLLPPHSVIPKSVACLFGRRHEPPSDMFTTDLEGIKHEIGIKPKPAPLPLSASITVGARPSPARVPVPVSLPRTPPRVSVQPSAAFRFSRMVLDLNRTEERAPPQDQRGWQRENRGSADASDASETASFETDDLSKYSDSILSAARTFASPDRSMYPTSSPPGLVGLANPATVPLPVTARPAAVPPPHGNWI